MTLSKITFVAPTTYADGVTALPTPDALAFAVLLDTVDPPAKSYAVPAAQTPTTPGATVTVTFAQLGFTPVLLRCGDRDRRGRHLDGVRAGHVYVHVAAGRADGFYGWLTALWRWLAALFGW